MTPESNISFERRLDRISLALTVLACGAAFFFSSLHAALSIAVGGLISTINFRWLKQAVDFVILRGGQGRVGKRVALQYAGRYALIGLTLYVTIRFSVLDPVLVLAGLLIYVAAVLLEAIVEIGKSLTRD